jgi:hypothetical protein
MVVWGLPIPIRTFGQKYPATQHQHRPPRSKHWLKRDTVDMLNDLDVLQESLEIEVQY